MTSSRGRFAGGCKVTSGRVRPAVDAQRATLVFMERAPGFARWTWLLFAVSVAFALRLSAASAPGLRLPDLDNRLVDPFQNATDTKAIVFLFISVDCPISNRFAPEVRLLNGKFAPRGVFCGL